VGLGNVTTNREKWKLANREEFDLSKGCFTENLNQPRLKNLKGTLELENRDEA